MSARLKPRGNAIQRGSGKKNNPSNRSGEGNCHRRLNGVHLLLGLLPLEILFFNLLHGEALFPESVEVQSARLARPAVRLPVVANRTLENQCGVAVRAKLHVVRIQGAALRAGHYDMLLRAVTRFGFRSAPFRLADNRSLVQVRHAKPLQNPQLGNSARTFLLPSRSDNASPQKSTDWFFPIESKQFRRCCGVHIHANQRQRFAHGGISLFC